MASSSSQVYEAPRCLANVRRRQSTLIGRCRFRSLPGELFCGHHNRPEKRRHGVWSEPEVDEVEIIYTRTVTTTTRQIPNPSGGTLHDEPPQGHLLPPPPLPQRSARRLHLFHPPPQRPARYAPIAVSTLNPQNAPNPMFDPPSSDTLPEFISPITPRMSKVEFATILNEYAYRMEKTSGDIKDVITKCFYDFISENIHIFFYLEWTHDAYTLVHDIYLLMQRQSEYSAAAMTEFNKYFYECESCSDDKNNPVIIRRDSVGDPNTICTECIREQIFTDYCNICMEKVEKSYTLTCCSRDESQKKMCQGCWNSIYNVRGWRSKKCPYCRAELPPLQEYITAMFFAEPLN